LYFFTNNLETIVQVDPVDLRLHLFQFLNVTLLGLWEDVFGNLVLSIAGMSEILHALILLDINM
jgi:hypothetical protein